jgi:uncharacterized protein YcbK (DUF882 family)
MKLESHLKIADNFTLGELTKRGGEVGAFIDDLSPEHFVNLVVLAQRLQGIRRIFGFPIIVNSGFRNRSYNRVVGGAESSQHLYGKAADIRPISNMQLQTLWDVVLDNWGVGGIGDGRPKGFIHVDTRDSNARWTY